MPETQSCAICQILWGRTQKARVDACLNAEGQALVGGHAWAYLCKRHHDQFGVGLGTGRGTMLP